MPPLPGPKIESREGGGEEVSDDSSVLSCSLRLLETISNFLYTHVGTVRVWYHSIPT